MTWNATYTVKVDGAAEMTSTTRLEADDFEDAMNAAVERKSMFRDGAEVRISSLKEIEPERRPIGFC